jgi:hypothetical protein
MPVVEQLEQAPDDEVWLIADSSDLRKPYAEIMPYLMQVRDLDEQLVPGYRTLNVIGVTLGRRGLLSRRLFSSQVYDFVSEPAEGIIRICSRVLEEEQQAVTSCLRECATSYATAARIVYDTSMWVLESPLKPMYRRE